MKSLLQFAALALLCVCAYAQTPSNQASDDTVVVGNTSQPVQWEHRNDIQAAILRAGPNGTVWIPAGYKGTDCNPVSTCNPGTTKIIDWRSGGGTTGVVTGTPNQITVNSNQVGDANPKILPGALIANGPVGINSTNGVYSTTSALCDFEGQANQDLLLCDLYGIGPVFNNGDGTQTLAYQLAKIQQNGYMDGALLSYHAAAGDFEPPANVTITDNNVSTPAVTIPGAGAGTYAKADGTGAGTPAGSLSGQQAGWATTGLTATTATKSAAFVDASLAAGAPDICLQIRNTETTLISSSTSAFQIVMPITNKAYCGTVPAVNNAHGDIYFVGNGARARIYTSVTWQGMPSGIHIHGTGPIGNTNTAVSNVQLVACNPLLHDNTYPGNAAGSVCPAFFNSTTNMPQATIFSITAAAGSPSTSTITLNGPLSGTPPQTFAGRLLCVGKENATELAANNGAAACYEINAEPTGGGTVFVVNSTNLVVCPNVCAGSTGKAFLDTPMIQFSLNSVGSTGFFVSVADMSVDCAYVYACANIVDGADQEGSYVRNVQMFNATAYGIRKFVGNSVPNGTGAAYNGNAGGGSHSGPDGPIWFNYQSEDCEITTGGGCWGMNAAVGGGTPAQFVAGTLMMGGTPGTMPATGCPACTFTVLNYSASAAVASSTLQRNMVGAIFDGINMGTNTQSFFGVNGITVSLKDVQSLSGTHTEMPEIINGIGIFLGGPTDKIDGLHVEYATTCIMFNGDAVLNETWIEDGSTPAQGITLINGDINNCSSVATGRPTNMRDIDLGAAQGTSNIMNVSIENLSISPASRGLQNQLIAGGAGDCLNATDKTLSYHFWGMTLPTGAATLISDCSGVVNLFPQGIQTPTNLLTPNTFATLAACAAGIKGQTATVTDSTVNTWGTTITGGGANNVLAFCNGTNWTVTGK